ncbi:MAG TPA: LysR family transcriptional regulator [Thiotrichaceae bacterium]|jgi:DNA-binding transcriptional LysR family regulator|nr:LysR family transcriptional regulator [Thiotrichaceae bacterium]HIM07792.1 LysR family transcriptional regulator [Gammaproteobacteria bacterium]
MDRFYYKQNRLKQLRAFCFTAQFKSMSKAAEQMFLSQPSISLLIQSLEKDLEQKLFLRKGPRIELTAEGDMLFEMSLPLVEGLETLPESFAEKCKHSIVGRLNIAAVEAIILYTLPDIIKRYAANYPDVHIKLDNSSATIGVEKVRNGGVDFAIGSTLSVPDDVVYLPIYTFEPVLITPIGHPLLSNQHVNMHDISQYGLILSPQHMSTWQMVDLVFKQYNVDYKVNLEAGGWEVLKKYVENGLGVSIVTDICLSGNEKLGRVPLSEYFPKRTYGLFVRKGKVLSPAAREFIQCIDRNVMERFNAESDQIKIDSKIDIQAIQPHVNP